VTDTVTSEQIAYAERVLATTIRRLRRKGHVALATALIECKLSIDHSNNDWGTDYYSVTVSAPEHIYDVITESATESVISLVLDEISPRNEKWSFIAEIEIDNVDRDWRDALFASLGMSQRNQGSFMFEGKHKYNGLTYKSFSETVLAKELDRRNILFFPLPSASRGGVIREPDFLVISKGRAGILEVHGAPYHPATRAAEDHRRNSFFEESGIRTFVYDAEDVRENVKLVADKFLSLLLGALK
jgi:hypothetical protein